MAALRALLWQFRHNILILALLFGFSLLTPNAHAGKPGDISGDGVVDLSDALYALKYVVGLIPHNPTTDAAYLAACDVAPLDTVTRVPKGDTVLDVGDALAILRHAVELDGWLTPAELKSLLIASPWRETAVTSSPAYPISRSAVPSSDLYSLMASQDRDDLLVFSTAGAVQGKEGVTKNYLSDPDVYYNSTWYLSGYRLTYGSTYYEILSLTSTSLVLKSVIALGGTSYTITETYVPVTN